MRSWRGWSWDDGNFGGSGLEPHVERWLADLLERNGMRLVHARQIVPQAIPLGRRGDRTVHQGGPVLRTALVSMTVEVVDLDKAAHAWKRGIGRHKAWGCGTLVARGHQPNA